MSDDKNEPATAAEEQNGPTVDDPAQANAKAELENVLEDLDSYGER